MKIAVDAMGGDNAPEVVIQGVLEAISEFGFGIVLTGDSLAIRKRFGKELDRAGVTVFHSPDVILMDESPLRAVRQKRGASVRVAFDLVKRGEADAVVSAGHSGAMLAAAILTLGKTPGVERPAFAWIFPGEKGDVILIDVGANVDCRPLHLLQFGVMAHVFATACQGLRDPKIGLLNIGEEGGKGNELARQAHELFSGSPLNFVGNVEGVDIFSGRAQIIVCDGFVGNIVLKVLEGMAESVAGILDAKIARAEEVSSNGGFASGVFQEVRKKLDYAEYGGVPILGVDGVGIVCHGASSPKAIKNAIKVAGDHVINEIPKRLSTNLARYAMGKAV